MAETLLPDELARALTSFRECFQIASNTGHQPSNLKELLKLFDWLADGLPAGSGTSTSEAVGARGSGEITLGQAKAVLHAQLADGVECPCCGQFCKVYKRKLNSCMAQSLIFIAQYFDVVEQAAGGPDPDAWLHVPEFLVRTMGNASIAGGDVSKLRYWELLEPRTDLARADGSNRQGFYRITARGRAFVRNEIRVPKHVFLYNQEFLEFSEEQTTIVEALADKFDYGELMTRATR